MEVLMDGGRVVRERFELAQGFDDANIDWEKKWNNDGNMTEIMKIMFGKYWWMRGGDAGAAWAGWQQALPRWEVLAAKVGEQSGEQPENGHKWWNALMHKCSNAVKPQMIYIWNKKWRNAQLHKWRNIEIGQIEQMHKLRNEQKTNFISYMYRNAKMKECTKVYKWHKCWTKKWTSVELQKCANIERQGKIS